MREMKDSGVEWIGEIPEDWSTSRLGYVCDEFIVPMRDKPQVLDGNIPWCRIEDIEGKYLNGTKSEQYVSQKTIDEMNLKVYPIGTVINSCSATIGVSAITTCPLCTNQTFIGLVAGEKISNVYLYYMMNALSEYMKFTGHGSTITYISQDKYKKFGIPLPSIYAQKCIAEYLDSKCTRIDEIIDKQQAIIDKLKEYKLSIITEAVTSGIEPDVEMKDSGSVWFGNIPINWEMKRLKYVFHIQKDIAGEEGHTVLSITQRGIIPKDFSNNEGQFANSYANYQLVHKGDFAMNHMDLLTGWVDISKYEGVTSPDYRVFVLNDKNGMCPEYYLYMMQMCYSARIFYGLGQGVSGMGRWRLQADKFLNFHIPIPPYEEQKLIADYITDKVNHIEAEIDKRNKIVDKYREYKKSLIYEVVTGKKEV